MPKNKHQWESPTWKITAKVIVCLMMKPWQQAVTAWHPSDGWGVELYTIGDMETDIAQKCGQDLSCIACVASALSVAPSGMFCPFFASIFCKAKTFNHEPKEQIIIWKTKQMGVRWYKTKLIDFLKPICVYTQQNIYYSTILWRSKERHERIQHHQIWSLGKQWK